MPFTRSKFLITRYLAYDRRHPITGTWDYWFGINVGWLETRRGCRKRFKKYRRCARSSGKMCTCWEASKSLIKRLSTPAELRIFWNSPNSCAWKAADVYPQIDKSLESHLCFKRFFACSLFRSPPPLACPANFAAALQRNSR